MKKETQTDRNRETDRNELSERDCGQDVIREIEIV